MTKSQVEKNMDKQKYVTKRRRTEDCLLAKTEDCESMKIAAIPNTLKNS